METLQTLRAAAKDRGLTFKTVNECFNGNQAYAAFSRESGIKLSDNNTLAYWKEAQSLVGIISEYGDK